MSGDSSIVTEVLDNSVLVEGLWQDFLKVDSYDVLRYEIEQKRWDYTAEKLFQIMWILDAGQTSMVNMWAAKQSRMKKSFGEEIKAYKNEEPPLTEAEYNVQAKLRMENYRNGSK